MPLELPALDDRTFDQLVEEAMGHIRRAAPDWTDLTPGDPGIVLVETFAFLTETMIYRLNRLPEKAYIAFLRLIGLRVEAPAAARAVLRFSREKVSDNALTIPRGTRVAVAAQTSAGAPMFLTSRDAVIPAGGTSVDVPALDCEQIDAELAGIGTGLPGLAIQVRRPPIIAPTGDGLDLIVGVETVPLEADASATLIEHRGRTFRVWQEVQAFTGLAPDSPAYVVDRLNGTVTFAPAVRSGIPEGGIAELPQALAAVPRAGREIRLWYRRGGGPGGNVARETLTVLKDPVPGVRVTNPEPAVGGQAAETLQNALIRGPQELHALRRAVTASDFELTARSSSRAVARARALTQAELWAHAVPGTVEVLLVPWLSEDARSGDAVNATTMAAQETDAALQQVRNELDIRRPLGTRVAVNWVRYKSVRVHARIVTAREENSSAVGARVIERLHRVINPLPTDASEGGWGFGEPLRISQVIEIAQSEPGVLWVDRVGLEVGEVPDTSVRTMAADAFQTGGWYAGSGDTLFRSLNDGVGWEAVGRFPGEQIEVVRAHEGMPGHVAVVSRLPDPGGWRVHATTTCGETWPVAAYSMTFDVEDAAWIHRGGKAVLLLATRSGLYELELDGDAGPVPVLVDAAASDLGFIAIAASREDLQGETTVALAAQNTGGIYLSSESGRAGSFRKIGLDGEDARVLRIQRVGGRSFLWVGVAALAGEEGKGCYRWELRGTEDPPDKWRSFGSGWQGGSVRAIAFLDTRLVAASHRAGVLTMDFNDRDPKWSMPGVNCGLPLRDPGRFHPVDVVVTDPSARLIMAGGPAGVFRSDDRGATYSAVSVRIFTDISSRVTLPPTWLFVSGPHDITVVTRDEAAGN